MEPTCPVYERECANTGDVYSRSVTRRFHRTVLTLAVLPLVVLIGLRSAWAAYACTIDREVRTSCCCPKPSDAAKAPRDGMQIGARCCCEITTGESSASPDTLADSSRLDTLSSAAVAAAPAPIVVAQSIAAIVRIERARPPPSSVPAYLFNRTILL